MQEKHIFFRLVIEYGTTTTTRSYDTHVTVFQGQHNLIYKSLETNHKPIWIYICDTINFAIKHKMNKVVRSIKKCYFLHL